MTTTTTQKSTTTVEIETSVVQAVRDAIAARDAGIAQAEEAQRSDWNRNLIDQAIRAFAGTGRVFSANDVRQVLPDDVPGPLRGARFLAARCRGDIRPVGLVTSTMKNTHAKPVGLWIGTNTQPEGAIA